MGILRKIAVTDRHGDEFTVYEFHDRRFLRKVRMMKLCTGEIVEQRGDQLVIAKTGERLKRLTA